MDANGLPIVAPDGALLRRLHKEQLPTAKSTVVWLECNMTCRRQNDPFATLEPVGTNAFWEFRATLIAIVAFR